MAKANLPKIITANDLLEGDVIYLTQSGEWTRDHDEALVVTDPKQAEALLAKAETQSDRLVGAYLADVHLDGNGDHRPSHFRETFRTRGPSNYLNHGKQAQA